MDSNYTWIGHKFGMKYEGFKNIEYMNDPIGTSAPKCIGGVVNVRKGGAKHKVDKLYIVQLVISKSRILEEKNGITNHRTE